MFASRGAAGWWISSASWFLDRARDGATCWPSAKCYCWGKPVEHRSAFLCLTSDQSGLLLNLHNSQISLDAQGGVVAEDIPCCFSEVNHDSKYCWAGVKKESTGYYLSVFIQCVWTGLWSIGLVVSQFQSIDIPHKLTRIPNLHDQVTLGTSLFAQMLPPSLPTMTIVSQVNLSFHYFFRRAKNPPVNPDIALLPLL